MRQVQIIPHEVEPITTKEWLPLALSIHNPKPRTPKGPQLLESLLRGSCKVGLDFRARRCCDDLFGLVRGEYATQGRCEVLGLGDIQLAVPHGLEALQEGCLELRLGVALLDVGEGALGLDRVSHAARLLIPR